MRYFYSAVNIFTDASVYKGKDEQYIISGFIAVYNDQIIKSDVKVYVTKIGDYYNSNYGELMAIRNAVECACREFINTPVNIFTDSLSSLWSIRKYAKSLNDDSLTNAKYCTITNSIVRMILDNRLDIEILHILSHCDSANVEDMWVFRSYFVELNNVPDEFLDSVISESLIYYNSEIDRLVKTKIREIKYNRSINKITPTKYCTIKYLNEDEFNYLNEIWS